MTTFTLLIAAMLAVSAAGLGGEPEYRVKGVFLYRMAHFLQWPESNLPPKAKTIVIGVVGKDPFG
ncbi:MAG: YfiR family protein, partial [Planctomycetes bacterium]|nr:YfiR family protein [Planctomycetota bacterium]